MSPRVITCSRCTAEDYAGYCAPRRCYCQHDECTSKGTP